MSENLEWWQGVGAGVAAALTALLVWLRKGRLRLRIRASYRSPGTRPSEPMNSVEPPPYRRRYDDVDDDG